MTATASSPAHLAQEQLSENDQAILTGLSTWVAQAAFDQDSMMCTDAGLAEQLAPLSKMDLVKKFPNPTFQIRRSFTMMPKVYNPRGAPNTLAAMVALRIIDGTPTVHGFVEQQNTNRKFLVGCITYIRDRVEVTPNVDILFIASTPS